MAKRGGAVRRASTCGGYSSPDPRAVSAPYANRRKMAKACVPGRPRWKKRKGMHKPLENIKESAELSKFGNVSSGCTREKNKNATLYTEEENKCDNGSSESFHDISNTEPECATSMKESETSSGSSLPSVSAVVTDWEYSTSQSLLTTLSSPEILRRSHNTERSQLIHDLMCDDYYTVKKNSTLLDCSKARDLDSVPDPENVSCVFSFPKTYEKCAKRSNTLQPKDPFVQQHFSTTVSGKKVYKIRQKHPPKQSFTSPAELKRQVELSPIHPIENDVELQPNSSGVFVHSSQIAPGSTLGGLNDMQKQMPKSPVLTSGSDKNLKPSSSGLVEYKRANQIASLSNRGGFNNAMEQMVLSPVNISNGFKRLKPSSSGPSVPANQIASFNDLGGFKNAELKPQKTYMCCIVTAPQCHNPMGLRRVACGKHALPTCKVEKDFLLDL